MYKCILFLLPIICLTSTCCGGVWYDTVVNFDYSGSGWPTVDVSIYAGNEIGNLFMFAELTVTNGDLISCDEVAGGDWDLGGDIRVSSINDDFTLTVHGSRPCDKGIVTGDLFYSFSYVMTDYISVIDASSGKWGVAAVVACPGLCEGVDSVLPYAEIVIPEPACFALLGLGGLLLRRRRL